jgi:hypothetical protein
MWTFNEAVLLPSLAGERKKLPHALGRPRGEAVERGYGTLVENFIPLRNTGSLRFHQICRIV